MELGVLVGLTLLALLGLTALLIRGSDPSAGPLWPRLEAMTRLDQVTLAVALLVPLGITGVLREHGWRWGWRALGMRAAMEPPFQDARLITAAMPTVRAGLDPLDMSQASDPRWRLLNYPRVWHLLAKLGVDGTHTELLAGVFVGLAWLAIVALALALPDGVSRALLGLGALSPAVLLGVERGNNDLLVFALTALGVLLLRTRPSGAVAAFVAAHVLKLFPVAALACLVELPRPRRRLLLVAGGAVALNLLLTAGDLDAIRATSDTDRGTVAAFGVGVAAKALRWPPLLPLAYAAAVGVLLLAAIARWRGGPLEGGPAAEPARRAAFQTGAGIYLLAFLLGPCWDYRLVFLLLVLPQLLTWTRAGVRRGLTGGALALALLSLWSDLGCSLTGIAPGAWLLVDELWNWGLFAALGWLLLASVPAQVSGHVDPAPGSEPS